MAAEKKTTKKTTMTPAAQQDEELRPPAWHDKHGRPELRMPRSFSRGSVTARVTPPQDDKSK